MPNALHIQRLPGSYAVCRLAVDAPLPASFLDSLATASTGLISITRTADEVSIIAEDQLVTAVADACIAMERDFAAYTVVGPLAFDMVGVLARLTEALADAGVPLLVVSTFDTDIILIKADRTDAAERALATVAILV